MLSSLFVSCRFDYTIVQDEAAEIEAVADYQFNNMDFYAIKKGGMYLYVEGEQASFYNENGQIEFKGISFKQFDETGSVVVTGTADSASVESASENVTISGNVICYSIQEETTILTNQLIWENQLREITSLPGEEVTFVKDNGSKAVGVDLKIITADNSMTMKNSSGDWVLEEEKKEAGSRE